MQVCVDWVLITFVTQVINKKRPVRPVFPDYLSVSYDHGWNGGEDSEDCFKFPFSTTADGYFILLHSNEIIL